MVIGRLDRFYPQLTARVSCGGTYLEIDPELVAEGVGEEFPAKWLDHVERAEPPLTPPEFTIFHRLMKKRGALG